MTNECKQQFTLRITRANKTEMIVILYDMVLCYAEDAKKAHLEENKNEYHKAIRCMKACLEELLASLHLEVDIARNIFSLYQYCFRELIKADARYELQYVDHVCSVIRKLADAYRELAKQDDSAPIMENSQTVYAGLTYGRNSLSENMTDQGANRGFFA